MDVEHLAQQLLRFAYRHDRRLDLVARAGPRHDVYFRFSEQRADSEHMMYWAARPSAAESVEASHGQAKASHRQAE